MTTKRIFLLLLLSFARFLENSIERNEKKEVLIKDYFLYENNAISINSKIKI